MINNNNNNNNNNDNNNNNNTELITYIHTYIYEIYNALHSRGWLESEARAVARWRGLGRNGREVECF